MGLAWGSFGTLAASLLQGTLSAILLSYFGPLQPLVFFTLLGQLTLPSLFFQWTELIHSANR
jgi:hypothetical protein